MPGGTAHVPSIMDLPLILFLTFHWPSALQVTQLGHVKDLATAFVKILGNPRAARQVYNISGER